MNRLVAFALAAFFLTSNLFAEVNDPLPPRAFLRIGTSKFRHGDRILCLAYSPDGKTLAASGGNDPLRLWNSANGELVRAINEPWVRAIAFDSKRNTIIFGGHQKHIRLWNIDQLKEVGRLDLHKAPVNTLAVSADNSTLVSGSQDGAIILWVLSTNSKFDVLKGHDKEVTALAFCPTDDNLFASTGGDGAVKFWNIDGDQARLKLTMDAGCYPNAVAFSADGKTLFTAGDDNLIRRWNVADGKPAGACKGHHGAVVSLIARGDSVISGSLDKTIRIWDAKTSEQRKKIARTAGDCDALAATKNADFIATGGLNNVIRLFEVKTGTELNTPPGPAAPVVGLSLSPDQQRLVSIASDGQVMFFDTKTGKNQGQWNTEQTGELSVAFAPDGKTVVTAGDTVREWHAEGRPVATDLLIKPSSRVVAIAFTPDSKTLALALHSGQIDLWDIKANRAAGNFNYPGPLHAIAFSSDGKKLAAAGGAKIFVWEALTRNVLRSFDVKEGPAPTSPMVRSLAFGPDGNTLAAGGWDAVIRIYDLNAKNPTDIRSVRVGEGHLGAVFALAFSADCRSLVSGSFDHTVRLWETFSGKQIAVFKGHVGEVQGVAFMRDGRSVFSAGTDANLFCWDVPGLSNNGKLPALTLGPAEIDSAWQILASEETPRGHEMMWRCIASAKQAVPQLTKDLYLVEPERVKKLFRDLDSDHFPTRIAAMKELTRYGRWMEGRYDAAMANPPSLEYKRRVEILKEKLTAANSPSLAQERLRVRRIMLMCEQVGSPDAIQALQKLADKGPEEELREEARASLQRLKK